MKINPFKLIKLQVITSLRQSKSRRDGARQGNVEEQMKPKQQFGKAAMRGSQKQGRILSAYDYRDGHSSLSDLTTDNTFNRLSQVQ